MYPSRKPASKPAPITDKVVWTRELNPRESYQIDYLDSKGNLTNRVVELLRIGHIPLGLHASTGYLGVMHNGQFKTLRTENVRSVRQLTPNHDPSIFAYAPIAQPQYVDQLPNFPVANAVYKMPTIALSKRTYSVDLNRYTCRCPEQRRRTAKGYQPGQLGFVCAHMARAILEHLPANAGWNQPLVKFLANPRKVHIDNLP